MAAGLSLAVWSWIGAGLAIVGVWLSGRNPRVGWIYGITAQVFWISYGAFTSQPGMIVQSCVFVAVYAANLRRWRGTAFSTRARAAKKSADAGSEFHYFRTDQMERL